MLTSSPCWPLIIGGIVLILIGALWIWGGASFVRFVPASDNVGDALEKRQ